MLDSWWNGLNLAYQVFYTIALATSLLLLLQLLMMLFGVDSDGHDADFGGHFEADGGDIGHGDAGTNLISIRSLTAFFTGFGWGGVGALNAGWSTGTAILVALAAGVAFMGMVLGVVRALFGLQASGNVNYQNAIGQIGQVYLPIPARMQKPGQVEVLVQGRLAVVAAFTRADRRLENAERVRVTEVLDRNTLVVEPLEAASSSMDMEH